MVTLEGTAADRAWKRKVAASFDRAAATYEQHACVQRQVAETLAGWLQESIDGNRIRSALEIGCGTGYLTRCLLDRFPDTRWLISDISPQMVETCRQHLETLPCLQPAVRFGVVDGERLDSDLPDEASFDLICSNLTLQWFTDLRMGLRQLWQRVQPGGWLCFSTLGVDNFAQVSEQFPSLKQRLNPHPGKSEVQQMLNDSGDCDVFHTGLVCHSDPRESGSVSGFAESDRRGRFQKLPGR